MAESDLTLIKKISVLEGELELFTDSSCLKLFCKCNSLAPGSVIFLQAQKIISENFPDLKLNLEVLKDLLIKKSDTPRKIAEGREPSNSIDEKFVIMAKPFSLKIKGFRYLELMEVGREVGRIYPPKVGQDGYNIFGQIIKASTPKALTLQFGAGVELQQREGYKSIVSRTKGYFYYENNVVDVKEELVIEGDVDQEVGSLRFNNRLTVKGSVGADFVVKSDGLIVIEGDVFKGSKVQSLGGDVKIKGLVSNAEIQAQGNAEVLSVIGSTAVSGGLLKILKESVSSSLLAKEIQAGTIIGGTSQIQLSLEVGVAGADSFLPTLIRCVSSQELSAEFFSLKEQIKKLELAKSLLKLKLGPFEYKNVKEFPKEVQEKIKNFREQLERVEISLEKASLRLKEIQKIDENQEIVVTFKNKVFPGVKVEFQDHFWQCNEIISKKIRLVCKLDGIKAE